MSIPGLDALLQRKYDILGTTADANANLANTQASVLPSDAAARQALEGAQASATQSAAGQIALDSQARRALEGSQENEGYARSGYTQAQTIGQGIQNSGTPGALSGADWDNHQQSLLPGFANGTAFVPGLNDGLKLQGAPGPGMIGPNAGTWGSAPAPTPNQDLRASMAGKMTTKNYNEGATKVPGQGDGTVDKVPAMLAPGEAVLNKGAAEHFGRDKIAALNSVGHAKMQAAKAQPQAPAAPGAPGAPQAPAGKPPAPAATKPPAKAAAPAGKAPGKPVPPKGAKPQELAKGTHHVMPGKSAKTPQMDPGAMQALAGMMGGGGGGMPPPGGAAPAGPAGPPMMPPQQGRGMV